MKKLQLWVATLVILIGFGACVTATAHAQDKDISGTWQGTLDVGGGRSLRTVLKISKADAGGLKASFYSIDQGGQAIPVTSISLQGPTLKMSIVAIGGTYEGKLTGDGSEIDGTWTQGGPIPLNL